MEEDPERPRGTKGQLLKKSLQKENGALGKQQAVKCTSLSVTNTVYHPNSLSDIGEQI